MRIDPGAQKLPAASTLVNVPPLITAYYTQSVSAQRVAILP
jgi:hypothetical protein